MDPTSQFLHIQIRSINKNELTTIRKVERYQCIIISGISNIALALYFFDMEITLEFFQIAKKGRKVVLSVKGITNITESKIRANLKDILTRLPYLVKTN